MAFIEHDPSLLDLNRRDLAGKSIQLEPVHLQPRQHGRRPQRPDILANGLIERVLGEQLEVGLFSGGFALRPAQLGGVRDKLLLGDMQDTTICREEKGVWLVDYFTFLWEKLEYC